MLNGFMVYFGSISSILCSRLFVSRIQLSTDTYIYVSVVCKTMIQLAIIDFKFHDVICE